ncbi:hypothetical protein Acr_16g0008310 [Actinidia rufa]|uniref:Uncharacterized protein n=1 Tax=Actinidia rufa TaxID=165716 RepID=A0A7J0G0E2_9ERIC|nr:hypothetical protein Acr_16g0008310 [Actinidia rufa]
MGVVRRYSVVQVTFCPLSFIGIIAGRCPRPSFQHSYYSEFAKKRRLGDNDGLSSGGHSFAVAISLSSGIEGFRARFLVMAGRDLCPSKACVEWCSYRASAQGTTELAL